MDVVDMGEGRGVNDFADSTSKLGSIVQINSIAIDISSSMEAMESPKHEHFSIRGFVSGMRNKDRRKCFPFASDGNDVDVVDYLPPLYVPEFRWWQCPNCIPKDETKRITEKVAVATKSDDNKSSFKNVRGKDGFLIHRGENTEDEDEDQSNIDKTPKLCCSERHKDITCSKDKPDTNDNIAGNLRDKPDVNQQQVIERLNNTPDATDVVCLADQPLCEVEAPDNASSGSDGTFSVLPHRRKPKLRYLADILVEDRNQTSSNPRTRSSSSCGMQVESSDMEAVFVPQLEVDVPADVGKGAQSHERKRKTALEDREPLAAICPRAAAKRIKGLVLDSEKNSRRAEISDPESKGGASTRLDVPRTQRIKPKKAKAIDADKKMRKIRRDDDITKMREYLLPNNVSSANLQEQVVPVETNPGKLGNAPSILVEMGREPHGFRSSLSGQQMEKISDPSTAKMPEVGPDNDYLWPPRKSILKNCNIRETMALDLSLNSFMNAEGIHDDQASFRERRCIPDLNVEYPGKTAMSEEEQSTILSKKRILPLQNTLDASASCSNEIVREGKQISELKNNDNNVERGQSDDIPMEIVELLAKNQHERALGNSRRHMLEADDTMKGYSAVVVDGRPSMANFPFPSRINGLKVANGNMGVKPNKRQTDMRRPEKSHFRLLSSSPPSQLRKPEYSVSASTMAGPTSTSWEELLYSCGRETVPFRLSVPQDHPIQPSAMCPHSFLDERHKERTTVEIKDSKGKKAVADVGKLKEGRIRSNYTSGGSLDPYSNETIPAMQLLSLMDQRVRSGSSYEVGSKSSLDKPFSPCKHHPRINGKENHSLFRVPFFSSPKDLSMLRYGVYSSGETTFRASSNLRVEVPREVRNSKTTPLEGSSTLDRRTERSNAVFGDCTLNRNPADFSIPEVGNEFTLGSKDLRRRKKRNAFDEKSRTGNVDGRKRERMRKNVPERECSR